MLRSARRSALASPLALLLAAPLTFAACQLEDDPERNSEDSERTTAIEMPMDRVIIDNVDFYNGDRTDWKYFIVPSEGLVKVVVNFDNENASPEVEVVNSVGQVLSNLELPESNQFLRQLSFNGQPGTYYLHVWVEEGETDYSAEAQFQP